jgi:uncharacterized protein YndB with AHSA1/START domain
MHDVIREIDLGASPDDVWELLTDDEERSAWFGGPSTLDLVPGGAGTFTDPDGTVRHASVDAVDPGRRLAWTWADDEQGSRVSITLTPIEQGTRVRIVERPLAPVASRMAAGALDAELRIVCRAHALV